VDDSGPGAAGHLMLRAGQLYLVAIALFVGLSKCVCVCVCLLLSAAVSSAAACHLSCTQVVGMCCAAGLTAGSVMVLPWLPSSCASRCQ
jgi:hypothetical protein